MKLSIIPIDNAVYIDGVLHFIDVKNPPEDIHALQWNNGDTLEPGDDKGEIEYRFDGIGESNPNKFITKLPAWTKKYVTAWEKADKQHKEFLEAESKRLAEEEAKRKNES